MAARGLDIQGVNRIVHYDLPENPEAFTHRSGRTGRAGAKGTSVLFVPPGGQRKSEYLARAAKIKIDFQPVPSVRQIQEGSDARLIESFTSGSNTSTSDGGERLLRLADKLLEEALAVEELPHQRLPRRHRGVGLDPHAAERDEALAGVQVQPATEPEEVLQAVVQAVPARLEVDELHAALHHVGVGGPERVVHMLQQLRVHLVLGVEDPDLEVYSHRAGHGLPVAEFPDDSRFDPPACTAYEAPFINECGFDAAGLLLRHLHPDAVPGEPQDAHGSGTLLPFDQTPFFDDATSSLRDAGFVYVPNACGAQSCRLHVAFHGCRQSLEAIHDDFVRDAGYNGWAAAGRIVVLYPQLTTSDANPNGCWDFWGYSGDDYRLQDGPQMAAVKAMIDRMLAND